MDVRFGLGCLIVLAIGGSAVIAGQGQTPTPALTFRGGVSRVVLGVTVRTKQGKAVTGLTQSDFQLVDSGEPRRIAEFRTAESPVSLGLLVDFSGSMDVAAKRDAARANAFQLLSSMTPGVDEAGLYVFDKELREVQGLAPVPGDILAQLDSVRRPFGATSLFDAIAETGRRLRDRGGPRRAVVALTDGGDNASRMTPTEVSALASGIDVPVYIIVVVSEFDLERTNPATSTDDRLQRVLEGPLANLARWTGGEIFSGFSPAQSNIAARQIVSELRQQYFIAFEPDPRPGWHPIEVRTREKDHVVRTRSGYVVGNQPADQQSVRPISNQSSIHQFTSRR
jgi:Ca-activated chloride channel family protein